MTYKCHEVETRYWSIIHKNVCEGLDGWMLPSLFQSREGQN